MNYFKEKVNIIPVIMCKYAKSANKYTESSLNSDSYLGLIKITIASNFAVVSDDQSQQKERSLFLLVYKNCRQRNGMERNVWL